MPRYTKDVFPPGVYEKGGKLYGVTAKDIDGFIADFERMRKAGYRAFVPWEHPAVNDEEAYPAKDNDPRTDARRKSKLNAGWVERLFKDDEGKLHVEIDVPREEDAERLAKVGAFVSPQFGKWKDEEGNVYDKAIMHVALTNSPVTYKQSNKFTPVEADKVLAMSTLGENEFVQLSMADMVQMGDPMLGAFTPGESGDDELDPEEDENDRGKGKQKKPTRTDRLRECLSKLGVMIPETTRLSGDLDTVIAAVESVVASKNGMGGGGSPLGSPSGGNNRYTEEPAQIAMSNETKTTSTPGTDDAALKAAEEKGRATALAETDAKMTQMSKINDALVARVTADSRERYKNRIAAAFKTGRCTKERHDSLLQMVEQYQFSTDAPDAKAELDIRLEGIEELPEGAVWDAQTRITQFSISEESNISPFMRPADAEMTDARAEELAKEQFGRSV